MLSVHDQYKYMYKYMYSYSAGIDLRRQILKTKVDPRAVRVKFLKALHLSHVSLCSEYYRLQTVVCVAHILLLTNR